jgi:hypothetical protein
MTTASFIRSNLLPTAGLVVPPLLWAANTEAGQILPYAECDGLKYGAIASGAAAVLSLVAGFLSWRTVRQNPSDATLSVTAYPTSFGFVGLLSGLNGALFAFALALQALSSLVLTGCER